MIDLKETQNAVKVIAAHIDTRAGEHIELLLSGRYANQTEIGCTSTNIDHKGELITLTAIRR